MQDDWQHAVAQYARAIEMYPYLREAYIDLALDYQRHQLYVLEQAVLIKGIASVHDDGRLHVLLGDAYEAQGDRPDALVAVSTGRKGHRSRRGQHCHAPGESAQRVGYVVAA